MRVALVVEEDVEGVARLHDLMAKADAVEPTRGEQGALFNEGALEQVTLLVLAAFAITKDQQGPGVVTAQLFERGLELQALLCLDRRCLPVSLQACVARLSSRPTGRSGVGAVPAGKARA